MHNIIREKRYLKENHEGVIIDIKKIKEMRLSILLLVLLLFTILILESWTSWLNVGKDFKRIVSATGLAIVLLIELWDLTLLRKSTAIFKGDLNDITLALKALRVYVTHYAKADGSYKFQTTLFGKELLLIKECNDFCEVTGDRRYMKYLAKYLTDMELKQNEKNNNR